MATKLLSNAALCALAAACSSGGGGSDNPDTGAALTTYVGFERRDIAFNGLERNTGSLLRGDRNFVSGSFSVIAFADEGVDLDYFGNAYQAADSDRLDNTVRILGRVRDRTIAGGTAVMTKALDRDIGFVFDIFNPLEPNNTTLENPKSVAIAHEAGFVIVTDDGDLGVKVFGTAAEGNVAPVWISATPSETWDVAYDAADDRLFVSLADGTIAVFDAFIETRPTAESRVIVPSADGVTQSSMKLRGIAHRDLRGEDELIVTDVGVEGAAGGTDGKILFIPNASTSTGPTTPTLTISGPQTQLVDPSDVVIAPDGRLRVADTTANRVSIFNPSSSGARYEFTPALTNSVANPAGIAIEPPSPQRMGGTSDVDDPATPLGPLVVSTRPAGSNGFLLRIPAALNFPPVATFDVTENIAAVALDAVGDAFVAYSGAGVAVVNRFAKQRGTGMDTAFSESRDRQMIIRPISTGPQDVFVDPRTIEIDERNDLVIVADPGLPGLFVTGRSAGREALAIRVLRGGFDAATNVPWGMDYDPGSDTLYVAGSSGAVYVYERFTTNPGVLPDRTITPSDAIGATQVSVDLRGLVHDAERDLLILSDVGAGSGFGDGSLFVLEGAGTASGLTPAVATITGAATTLDEPLDLAWNGSSLWVAENAGGALMRFDDLLMLDGNVAPTATFPLPDVVSVELNPESLSPPLGGSIHVD
ncbi:MAG: hypothetical protein AAF957_16105 [Planctomycetota bacterium]